MTAGTVAADLLAGSAAPWSRLPAHPFIAQAGDGSLQYLGQTLVEQGDARRGFSTGWAEHELRHVCGSPEGLQVLGSFAGRYGVWNVHHGLRGLPDWDGGHHLVLEGIDGSDHVAVLDSDVHAGAVPGRPDSVRQLTDGDSRHLFEGVGTPRAGSARRR